MTYPTQSELLNTVLQLFTREAGHNKFDASPPGL